VYSSLRAASLVLAVAAVAISACGPSESAIQTAIAATQTACPTYTPTPDPQQEYVVWYQDRRVILGDIWGDASLAGERALTQAATGDTSQSRTRLDEFAEEVSALLSEARDIDPPDDMSEIHALFVETLRVSESALTRLGTTVALAAAGMLADADAELERYNQEMDLIIELIEEQDRLREERRAQTMSQLWNHQSRLSI